MIVKSLLIAALVLSQANINKLKHLVFGVGSPPVSMAYAAEKWTAKDSYYRDGWNRIRPQVSRVGGDSALDALLKYQDASLKDPKNPHKAYDWGIAMFNCAYPYVVGLGEMQRYASVRYALATAKDPKEPEYERLRFLMECCLGLTGKDFHSLKVAGYKLMAVFPKDMMVPYYLLMAMTSDKASLSEAEVLAEAQVHFHPGNFELVRAWSGIAGAKYYATLKKEDLLEAIRRTRHVIDIAPTDLPKAETESIARYLRLAESIRVSKGW